MAYAEKTFYSLACDGEGCKAEFESSEYDGVLWMGDKEDLVDSAEEGDWSRQDDGRVLCHDCRMKPGGDLHDEEAV